MNKLPEALCGSCPLNSKKAVPGYGPLEAEIVFVGEAPGRNEEMEGVPFVGQSGRLLEAMMEEVGFKKKYYKTNVVACRPDDNVTPSEHIINCCAPRLKTELAQLKRANIVSMGKTAHSFFNIPSNQMGVVERWADKLVMPTWHPAYVLRSPDQASLFKETMRRAAHGPFEFEMIPKPELRWPKSLCDLRHLLKECPDNAWVAFDVETDQIQWYDTELAKADLILMMQLAWGEDAVIIIDHNMLHDQSGVHEVLKEFFGRVRTCAHNGKFDTVFIDSAFDYKIPLTFDTMLAHYALDENLPHGLKSLASLELGIRDFEKETILPYLKTRGDRYSKVPEKVLAMYGAWDVVITLRLRKIFEERLKAQGRLQDPFYNILMPAHDYLHDVELRGFEVDRPHLDKVSTLFDAKIKHLVRNLRTSLGKPELNPNSTQQLAKVYYDELNFPPTKTRNVGLRTTGKAFISKNLDKHPSVPILKEYRRVAKLQDSYVNNMYKFMDLGNRVHADFRIQGTEVGRLSVRKPALQTIPRADENEEFGYGALIKSMFVPRQGWVLVVCDYSQAELRVFACLANEPFLLEVYRLGRDLHSEVAISMYGENYTKEQRVQCKMFNFSYVYGGNEHSFAKEAGLNITVARKFVLEYNELMPTAIEWKRQQFRDLKAQGYVETVFGRRRHFPLITSRNEDDARKASVHMPIASTANDLALLAGMRIEGQGGHSILLVHDSVITECPKDEGADISAMMKTTMEDVASQYFPQIPFTADSEVRNRWAEVPEML